MRVQRRSNCSVRAHLSHGHRSGMDPLRDVAPWLRRLATLGFAAKGVVYVTVGLLAARVALGSGGQAADQKGALGTIASLPFGRSLLVVIAIGLAGYAAW